MLPYQLVSSARNLKPPAKPPRALPSKPSNGGVPASDAETKVKAKAKAKTKAKAKAKARA